jgi:hypothetical protein
VFGPGVDDCILYYLCLVKYCPIILSYYIVLLYCPIILSYYNLLYTYKI